MAKSMGWIGIPLAAALAVPALAGPSVDFDQMNFNVKDIVEQAKASAQEQPKAEMSAVQAAYVRAERDCAHFTFEPNGPSVSEGVWLRSTEYIEECRYVPGPPDHGGGYRDCWERPGWTYRKKAQIEIANRQTVLPWERERFTVCLEGPWIDLDVDNGAYEYKVKDNNDGYFLLIPGKKIPSEPDAAGIIAGIPANTGSGLALEFTDRWASYYGAGEQTVIHAELFREVRGWFDAKVAGGDLAFKPATSYRIDFAAFSPKLEAGKSYYVKWGFKRIGKLSKPNYVKRGETEKTVFNTQPAPAPAAR